MYCRHCGGGGMHEPFLDRLWELRKAWGQPMVFSSAYRCAEHPIEKAKPRPGAHTQGRAVDIVVSRGEALTLIRLALDHGFTGIGVNQKGPAGRFIHLDDLENSATEIRPTIWSY